MTFEGCCGQPVGRRRRPVRPDPLPPNPEVKGGVMVLFLGSGTREVKGAVSGLTYVVSDQRRHFRARRDDLDALLKSKEFMLQL